MLNPTPYRKGIFSAEEVIEDLVRVKKLLDDFLAEETCTFDFEFKNKLLKSQLIFSQITDQIERTLDKLSHSEAISISKKPSSEEKVTDLVVRASLLDCVREGIQSMKNELPLNKVTVLKIIPKDLPKLFIDPEHLTLILSQLFERARHCLVRNTGIITIEAQKRIYRTPESEHQSQICIRISDSGSGIAEKDLPHIFDPSHSSFDYDVQSGYRLYLVKKLVELYSGTIRVETSRDGTSFHLAFFSEGVSGE